MASAYNAYVFTLLIPPALLSMINADLGPSPNFTWITISWNLGGAIFVTVGGRLSDLFGRRWFFIVGSAILVLGSIIGATGQSIPQMIACGAVYGAGSGFLEMAYGAVQVCNPFLHITLPICSDHGYRRLFQISIEWLLSAASTQLPSSLKPHLYSRGHSSVRPAIGATATIS